MEESMMKRNVILLQSDNEDNQLNGMECFKILLAFENPNVEMFLEMKILPRIVELMRSRDDDEFRIFAAWVLTNVASISNKNGSEAIIEAKGLIALTELFEKTSSFDLKGQCLWALSNIIEDGEENRDSIIKSGIFEKFVEFIEQVNVTNYHLLQISIWFLANLNNHKYAPLTYKQTSISLDILISNFYSEYEDVKGDALRGICFISNQSKFAKAIINLVPDLIPVIEGDVDVMKKYALHVIGNIAFTTETQILIKTDLCKILKKLLYSDDDDMVKGSAWIFSNITVDGYVNELDDIDIYPKIVELLKHKNFKIRREAVHVINNTLKGASFELIKKLVCMEFLRYFTPLINEEECHETVQTICESIFNLLKCGHFHYGRQKQDNLFVILVERYGGEIALN